MKEVPFSARIPTVLLLLTLVAPLLLQIAPSAAQEETKTTFNIIASYNPPPVGHFNYFVGGCIGWSDLVLEILTHYHRANESYVPGIATEWTVSEDYMVFNLTIRQGVLFHDRHELTADDIIATYYSGVYLFKMRPWTYLKNITKVNDYQLTFYMKEPNDYVPFYVLWHFPVLPSTQYGQFADRVRAKIDEGYDIYTNETAFQDIIEDLKAFRPSVYIGTGPYVVKSVTATEIVLEKFTEYWGGVPPIDEIHIINVKSEDVAWSLRLSGEADWYWGTPTPEYYDKLKACSWFTLVKISRPLGPAIYFNYKKYPFNITEFKKAIAYAINRTALAYIQYPIGGIPEEYQLGFSTAALETALNETFIRDYINGTTYDFRYDYNVTKAKEILDSIGFIDRDDDGIRETPNGTKLEFDFLGAGSWLAPEAMEAVATMLEEVGIKLTVRLIDSSTWFASDGPFYMGRYYICAFFGVASSPEFMFDEMFVKYSTYYPGCGFPDMVTVPWKDEPINVTALTLYLQTYPAKCTREERDEIRAELAFVAGQYLPKISLFTRPVIIAMNTEKFAGWPSVNDTTYWNSLSSYMTHGISYLFRWGLLKPKFRLTVSVTPSEAGTTTPASGEYSYVKGENVTVSVTPAEGYEFKYWLLDGKQVSTSETYTVTMAANHELKAVFEEVTPPPPPYGLYAGVGAIIAAIIIAAAIFLTRR